MKKKYLCCLFLIGSCFICHKNEAGVVLSKFQKPPVNVPKPDTNPLPPKPTAKPVNKFLDVVVHPTHYKKHSRKQAIQRTRLFFLPHSPLVNDITDLSDDVNPNPKIDLAKSLHNNEDVGAVSSYSFINLSLSDNDNPIEIKPSIVDTSDTGNEGYISFKDLLSSPSEA